MSRRPTPTAIKKLQGNQGHRPLNANEPTAPAGVPEMPRGMPKAARREWVRMCADLMTLKVLTVVDGKGLMAYCLAYADCEASEKQCEKKGRWIEEPIVSKDGQVVGYKNKMAPWFATKYIALKTMRTFLIEYGLTPASRSKLKMDKPAEVADEFPTREQMSNAADDLPNLNDIDTSIM
jgi:P27 family predicted phage terminase small subunit